MATRKSLTSRGYTSVQAGPSSTNRFLKPPRTVSEYKTVAEEVATAQDLRTAKNAVGPAAQPLRPRARVEEQQISEGSGMPEPSGPIGMNQALNAMMSAQSIADKAKYGAFAPGPIGLASGVIGGIATAGARAADVTYSNMRTDKENSNAINTNSSKIGFFDNVTKALSNPIDSIVSSIPSMKDVEEEITGVPDLVQDALSFVSLGAISKSAPAIQARTTVQKNKDRNSAAKTPDQNRKSMEKDLNYSNTITEKENSNQGLLRNIDLQQTKQTAQTATLEERQKANDDIQAGNYKSSGSDSGNEDSSDSYSSGDGMGGQDQYD